MQKKKRGGAKHRSQASSFELHFIKERSNSSVIWELLGSHSGERTPGVGLSPKLYLPLMDLHFPIFPFALSLSLTKLLVFQTDDLINFLANIEIFFGRLTHDLYAPGLAITVGQISLFPSCGNLLRAGNHKTWYWRSVV